MKLADRMKLKQIKALVKLYENRGQVSHQTADLVRSIDPDMDPKAIRSIMELVADEIYGYPAVTPQLDIEGKEVENDGCTD